MNGLYEQFIHTVLTTGVWPINVHEYEDSKVLDLGLLKHSIKAEISEIFRIFRPENEDFMEDNTRIELLWFELFGMQRVIRNLEWQLRTCNPHLSEVERQFVEIQELLTAALKQAEDSFDKHISETRYSS